MVQQNSFWKQVQASTAFIDWLVTFITYNGGRKSPVETTEWHMRPFLQCRLHRLLPCHHCFLVSHRMKRDRCYLLMTFWNRQSPVQGLTCCRYRRARKRHHNPFCVRVAWPAKTSSRCLLLCTSYNVIFLCCGVREKTENPLGVFSPEIEVAEKASATPPSLPSLLPP